jgi:hypothetical protein
MNMSEYFCTKLPVDKRLGSGVRVGDRVLVGLRVGVLVGLGVGVMVGVGEGVRVGLAVGSKVLVGSGVSDGIMVIITVITLTFCDWQADKLKMLTQRIMNRMGWILSFMVLSFPGVKKSYRVHDTFNEGLPRDPREHSGRRLPEAHQEPRTAVIRSPAVSRKLIELYVLFPDRI